jgi:hypothetical protein
MKKIFSHFPYASGQILNCKRTVQAFWLSKIKIWSVENQEIRYLAQVLDRYEKS